MSAVMWRGKPIVITSEQKRDGYMLKVGDTIIQLEYYILSDRKDGTYLATYSHRVLL